MKKGADDVEMRGQAEQWFLRLQEPGVTPDERAAAQRWRAAHPAHDAAWRQVEAVWRDTGDLAEDPAIADALRAAERPYPRAAARRSRGWWPIGGLAAAAMLALAVVIVPGRWGAQDLPPGIRYATVLGEQRTVELADGSTVLLDTATVLTVRYANDRRRIDLQEGRADFQVRSDPGRPFVVQAAGGAVTAVGTRFQVRTQGTAAAVTLLEGVVQVEPPESQRRQHDATMLEPGQRLRFDAADASWMTDTIDLDIARGWAEGNIFARDRRLADLLAEMNRYSTTQLRLADPALADLPISGTFRVGDHASLVLALEHGWALHASRSAGGDIELSRQGSGRR